MPQPIATSEIAALAFSLVELDPISSFADDSDQARMAAQFYPKALEAVIGGTDWSFASTLVELPEADLPGQVVDPDLPWHYALPADVLRIRHVADGRASWRRDKLVLRADRPGPLLLRYTARITDESRIPAEVSELIAYRLALIMAPRWLGSQTKRDQLRRDMTALMPEARRADADQASMQPYQDTGGDDWVRSAMR
ncbi:MAG: hypothetical protein ACK4LQ_02095 [Pararhodobacter sp.]